MPVKRIWENLYKQGDIKFSYQSFIGYVNRLILAKTKDTKKPTKKVPIVQQIEKTDTSVIKSFVYDPFILTKKRFIKITIDKIYSLDFEILFDKF